MIAESVRPYTAGGPVPMRRILCSYLPVKRLEMHLARSPCADATDGARPGRYPPREGVRSVAPHRAHVREPHRRHRSCDEVATSWAHWPRDR